MKKCIAHIKSRINASDLAKRMASGAFWSVLGSAGAKLMVVLAGIACARILGKEIYGQFGMVKSTIAMLMVFGNAGLGLTATKYIAEYRVTQKQHAASVYIVTNFFAAVVATVVGMLVFFCARWVAVTVLQAPELTMPLKVCSVITAIVILNLAQDGVLSGFEDFKHRAINLFIGDFLQAVAMMVGAYYFGLMGTVLGYGVGLVAVVALNWRSIRLNFRKINVSPHFYKIFFKDFRLLYSFSLPAAISSMLAGPVYWLIRAMIVRYNGFGEVALYDVADQWRQLILFVPASVSQILLPILSSLETNESNQFLKVLKVNLTLNASLATVMALLVSVLSGVIIAFYGQGFTNNWPIIVLSVSCIFNSISNLLGISITSKGKMWTWCGFNVLWGTVALGLSWLALRLQYAATGIAAAICISYFCHALWQWIYVKHVILYHKVGTENQSDKL